MIKAAGGWVGVDVLLGEPNGSGSERRVVVDIDACLLVPFLSCDELTWAVRTLEVLPMKIFPGPTVEFDPKRAISVGDSSATTKGFGIATSGRDTLKGAKDGRLSTPTAKLISRSLSTRARHVLSRFFLGRDSALALEDLRFRQHMIKTSRAASRTKAPTAIAMIIATGSTVPFLAGCGGVEGVGVGAGGLVTVIAGMEMPVKGSECTSSDTSDGVDTWVG